MARVSEVVLGLSYHPTISPIRANERPSSAPSLNYELPFQQDVPENVSAILPLKAQSKPTDENFKIILTRAVNKTAWLRSGEILRETFKRNVKEKSRPTP